MPKYSPLEPVYHPIFEQYGIQVLIKRDDLIHPIISGNKWRKLKYNIDNVKEHQLKGIVSFGGSYSNHIHAVSFACKINKLNSVGIIRGEEEYANNATLSQAQKWGMKLEFINRKSYKERNNPVFLQQLQNRYPDYYIVPEGGSNELAIRGVKEVCHELKHQTKFDTLITPVGSAGTMSGLILGDNEEHNIIGIAVLKQAEYLNTTIKSFLSTNDHNFTNWKLLSEFHCGGYAKFSQENLADIVAFSKVTGIPFEPIYSGKMVLALLTLVKQGYFAKGHRIVLLHTGGLQGLAGLAEQKRVNLNQWQLPSAPEVD